MRRIHLFRPGAHTPMRGGTLEFSAADLDATARAYDPAKHEAPLVVGHPQTDAPAYGWVGKLSAEADGLFAEPRQVEPAFAELVQAGRFKKVSVALYTPRHPENPAPGTYYLKHVGFLGATAPAVKGLKPVEFATAHDDQVVTVEFGEMAGWRLGWIFSDIAALFRGVRDHLVARDGVEEAEKVLPGAAVQRMAEEAARLQAETTAPAAPAPGFTEPTEPKDDGVSEQDAARRAEELAARERAIAEKEAAFAAREAERTEADNRAFVQDLVKQGRLPQGLAPRVAAFMGTLSAEVEIAFAEGAKTVKQPQILAFREMLSGLPAAVPFGELAGGEGPGAGDAPLAAEFAGRAVDPDRMALHAKALAYQQAHPNVDYVTAVLAVEKAG